MNTCTVAGCDRKVKAKGLCLKHYERKRRGVSLTALRGHHTGPMRKTLDRTTKVCPVCLEEKGSEDFYKNKKGQWLSYCKPCHADYRRAKNAEAKANRPPKPPKPVVQCSAPECTRDAKTKGLCPSHYNQQWAGREVEELGPYHTSYISDHVRMCTTCLNILPAAAFYNRTNGKKQSRCRTCHKQISSFGFLMREGRVQEAATLAELMAEPIKQRYLDRAASAIKAEEFERSND